MKAKFPLLPRRIRWLFALVIAAFIFYTSIITVPPGVIDPWKPELLPLDKWRHFVAYGALGYALAYAAVDWDVNPWLVAGVVISITIGYGVGIELIQSVTPHRYFSLGDAYANAFGGLLVTPFYLGRSFFEFVSIDDFINTVRDIG